MEHQSRLPPTAPDVLSIRVEWRTSSAEARHNMHCDYPGVIHVEDWRDTPAQHESLPAECHPSRREVLTLQQDRHFGRMLSWWPGADVRLVLVAKDGGNLLQIPLRAVKWIPESVELVGNDAA